MEFEVMSIYELKHEIIVFRYNGIRDNGIQRGIILKRLNFQFLLPKNLKLNCSVALLDLLIYVP